MQQHTPVPMIYIIRSYLFDLLRLIFLPRDASAERGDATVSRLSVCPSLRDV